MKTVTIQQTAKRYKLAKLIGQLLLIASIGCAIWAWIEASLNTKAGDYTTAIIIAVIAVALLVYARIGKWWNND